MAKTYTDPTKPCSRVVVNYCKNITDSYCGYIASPGYISYTSDNNIEEIMNILRYNDYQSEDSDFLLNALIFGVASELMYVDNESHTRFRLISPLNCFGVYDDTLSGDLMYFVRFYKADEWGTSDVYNLDVYSDYDVKHYIMNGIGGMPEFVEEERHYFSQCPANIFYLPDEKSIFDCILSLQDAANELLSSEIDDYSAFCDAYLKMIGVDADSDDIATMKENRVILLPQDAEASWLTKDANDAQVENMQKRIQNDIYRIAACPDFSSDSFTSGVSSGVAIRYRLTGMETRAAKIAAEMKKALQRRVEIICGIATLKLGEEVFRDINIDFTRNIPDDLSSTVQVVNQLRGMVSDETLLGLLPFVANPVDEAKKVQAQKQENAALYSFTTGDGDE